MLLVVEDDRALRALLQSTLEAPGRTVILAATMAEAQTALAAATPALVLLDLILPDGDGRNLLVQLRKDPATRGVPVVVMSALRATNLRSECHALGCDAFLDKPLDLTVLATTVSTLLARSAAAKVAAPAPGRSVLLAEDDPVIAALVQHRLSREGFDVVTVANGLDALDRAGRGRFVLAILDVNMPGISGFALLERLRALPTFAATPIMMLTAMGNESDVARALDLGANDYVVKPFSPVELVARVRRLVAPR